MRFLQNVNTRSKLGLAFGILAAFMVAVMLLCYDTLARIRDAQSILYEQDLRASTALIKWQRNVNLARASYLDLPRQLTFELLEAACASYFVDDDGQLTA